MKADALNDVVVAVLCCCTDLQVRVSGQTLRWPARRFLVGSRRQLPGDPVVQ
jgi:hypothetical protein